MADLRSVGLMEARRGLVVSTVRIVVIAFIACSAATRAVAQDTTGTMSGRIVDAQGLAVPGVTVSGSQGKKAAVTDNEGRFTIPFLTPGLYVVHADLRNVGLDRRAMRWVRHEEADVSRDLKHGASVNRTWIGRAGVRGASLLSWWESFSWSDGVQMDHLDACDRLTVLTQHSTYEIVVVAPTEGKVLVRGGQFFPISLERA